MRTEAAGWLSAQDEGFLALDRARSPMNIGIVARFRGPTRLPAALRCATERLHALPASGLRPAPRRVLRRSGWQRGPAPPLERVSLGGGGEAALLGWLGVAMAKPFGAGEALWRGAVLDGFAPDEFALALNAHHALIDGAGGLAWWGRVFDDEPSRTPRPRTRARAQPPALQSTASLVRAGLRSTRATELNGPLDGERHLRTLRLGVDALHALRRRADVGASINDALLGLIAWALGRVLPASGDTRPLRVLVPVDRRGEGGHGPGPGNRLGGMLIECPFGVSLEEHIAAVSRQSRIPRRAAQSRAVETLGRAAAWLPSAATPAVFALAGRYRVFNFVFSALRGPSTRPTLAGAPLTDAVAFGPLFPRVRCNLTALRLGAEVRIGLTSSALTSAWLEALCGEIRSGVEDSGRVEHGADTG